MSDKNLHNLLTNIIKEKSISNIIIENKKDMDLIQFKQLYNQWVKEERLLSKKLDQAKNNVRSLKLKIKNMCKHNAVTEIISSGWERDSRDYRCNQCGFYLTIHEDFDYRNITKTIDY